MEGDGYAAPFLHLTAVWETELELTVSISSQEELRRRPNRWQLEVTHNDGLQTTKMVPVESEEMTLRLDRLTPHADIRIRVRGVNADGTLVGQWATLSQALLPQLTITQSTVEEKVLNFKWHFGGWSSPIGSVVSKYELHLVEDDYSVTSNQEFTVGSGEIKSMGGCVALTVPPSVRRNRMHVVRMRCYSSRLECWGAWSPSVQLFTLSPVLVNVTAINEESATVVWGRYGPALTTGQDIEWPETSLDVQHLALAHFRVYAWEAAPLGVDMDLAQEKAMKELQDETSRSPDKQKRDSRTVKFVEGNQLQVTKANTTVIKGLKPQTAYNVKVQWKNTCGGEADCRYLRFQTAPRTRVVRVPKVASHFVEVDWELFSDWRQQDLNNFCDDDLTDVPHGISDQLGVPGAPHGPKGCHYQLVLEESAVLVPLFYRIELTPPPDTAGHGTTGSTSDKASIIVDQTHRKDIPCQHARITNLEPGTPYTLRVRCAGASHLDVDQGIGLEKAIWGSWTEQFVVTTLKQVEVKVEQRGASFFELSWITPVVPGLMAIDADACCLVDLSLQSSGADGATSKTKRALEVARERRAEANRSKFLKDPTVNYVDGVEIMFGIEMLHGALVASELPGEGDLHWGVGQPESEYLKRTKHCGCGTTKFVGLDAGKQYRLSYNCLDSDGNWLGRHSMLLSTLAEEVLSVQAETKRSGGLVQIDERFHLEQQELPRFGASSEGRMLYQVKLTRDREQQLRCIAFASPTRVGNIALVSEIDTLGNDHAVIHWRGYHVLEHSEMLRQQAQQRSSVSFSGDIDSSQRTSSISSPTADTGSGKLARAVLRGDDPPPAGSLRRVSSRASTTSVSGQTDLATTEAERDEPEEGSEEEPETAADKFNRLSTLIEYRIKVVWEPLHGTVANFSQYRDSGAMDLYYRSCTRRTKLVGLRSDCRYQVSLSMFSSDRQQWTPWSKFLSFTPITTLMIYVKHVSCGGVQLQWRRREHTTAQENRAVHSKDLQPTVVKKYAIETSVPGLGTSKALLEAPASAYLLKDLPTTVSTMTVQPLYAFDSWGPKSPPIHIAIEDVRLIVKAVGRQVIVVEWVPLASSSCENNLPHRDTRRILLSIKSKEWSNVVEVPYDTSSYTFERLTDATSYVLSAKGIKETALCHCCNRGAAYYEASQCPQLAVTTLNAPTVTVEHVSERFVSLRWRRSRRGMYTAISDGDEEPTAASPSSPHPASPLSHSAMLNRSSSQPPLSPVRTGRTGGAFEAAGGGGTVPTLSRMKAAQQVSLQPGGAAAPQGTGDQSDRYSTGTPRTVGNAPSSIGHNRLTVEAYMLFIKDIEYGCVREERVVPSASFKGHSISKRVTGLKANGLYEFTVRPVLTNDGLLDIGSTSPFVRTLSPLQIHPVYHSDNGMLNIALGRQRQSIPPLYSEAKEDQGNIPEYKRLLVWKKQVETFKSAPKQYEDVVLRNPVEMRVEELSKAPICGKSKAVGRLRRSTDLVTRRPMYCKRMTFQASDAKAHFDDLSSMFAGPQGNVESVLVKISARQKSHDDVWCEWASETITIPRHTGTGA